MEDITRPQQSRADFISNAYPPAEPQSTSTSITPESSYSDPASSYQDDSKSAEEWLPMPSSSLVKEYSDRPKTGKFLRSTAYLPEYFVMLVLLGTAVAAIISLIGLGIDSLIKGETSSGSSSYSDIYTGSISTFQLVSSLSALIVSLPIFGWLFIRTRRVESENTEVKQNRWRKGFLGIFLVIQGLSVVWTLGDLAYDLLSRMVGDSGAPLSYFSSGGADPWWQQLITSLLGAAILMGVVFVMSRDYRSRESSRG